jgi:uncharacterized protein (DUF983 family)
LTGDHPSTPRFWPFFKRSLRLRCPECGVSPIFPAIRRVRSLWDWFTPLDGCPRCGYAYLREEGYFLLATWVINYGIIAGLAVIVSFTLDELLNLTIRQQVLFVFAPMPVLSLLFARHAKSMWLAMDHYFDPHRPADC